jgi:hypothetical protein
MKIIRGTEYIYGQAKSIKDARSRITSHCDEIAENFMKIMLAPPGCLTLHHWKSEIFGHLSMVPMLEDKNKYPEPEQIYKWTVLDQLPELHDIQRIQRIIRNISRKDNFHIPRNFDYHAFSEKLIGYLDIYYQWLSQELSRYGVVDSEDVQHKVDEIMGLV